MFGQNLQANQGNLQAQNQWYNPAPQQVNWSKAGAPQNPSNQGITNVSFLSQQTNGFQNTQQKTQNSTNNVQGSFFKQNNNPQNWNKHQSFGQSGFCNNISLESQQQEVQFNKARPTQGFGSMGNNFQNDHQQQQQNQNGNVKVGFLNQGSKGINTQKPQAVQNQQQINNNFLGNRAPPQNIQQSFPQTLIQNENHGQNQNFKLISRNKSLHQQQNNNYIGQGGQNSDQQQQTSAQNFRQPNQANLNPSFEQKAASINNQNLQNYKTLGKLSNSQGLAERASAQNDENQQQFQNQAQQKNSNSQTQSKRQQPHNKQQNMKQLKQIINQNQHNTSNSQGNEIVNQNSFNQQIEQAAVQHEPQFRKPSQTRALDNVFGKNTKGRNSNAGQDNSVPHDGPAQFLDTGLKQGKYPKDQNFSKMKKDNVIQTQQHQQKNSKAQGSLTANNSFKQKQGKNKTLQFDNQDIHNSLLSKEKKIPQFLRNKGSFDKESPSTIKNSSINKQQYIKGKQLNISENQKKDRKYILKAQQQIIDNSNNVDDDIYKNDPPEETDKQYYDEEDDLYYDQEEEDQENYDAEVAETKDFKTQKQQDKKFPDSNPKPSLSPCHYFQTDQCKKGDSCQYLHFKSPKVSEEQCQFFVRNNTCKYGDENCQKKHDEKYRENYQMNLLQAIQITMQKEAMKQQYQQVYKAREKDSNVIEESTNIGDQQSAIQFIQYDKIKEQNKHKNLNELQKTWKQDQIFQIKQTNQAHKQQIKTQNEESLADEQDKQNQKYSKQYIQKTIEIPNPTFIETSQPIIQCYNSPEFVAKRITQLTSKLQKMQQNSDIHIIPGVALSLQMCPQAEIESDQRDKSHLEKDQKGQQFDLLAVKKYVRSDAGKAMDNPIPLRPPKVLYITMKYMRDCLVDQDLIPPGQSFYEYKNQCFGELKGELSDAKHSFMDIYLFMKDRTRQLSQDLSIINRIPSKYSVGCLEQQVRYFVISQHDGISAAEFDFYTNLKQMTGVLGSLNAREYLIIKKSPHLSNDQKVKLLSNQVEMICYQIIASSQSPTELQKLLNDTAKLNQNFTIQERQLLGEATKIATSIQLRDSQRFFKLFKQTNYMFACLMLSFFHDIRSEAFRVFASVFRGQIQGSFVASTLLLPDKADCYNCLVAYGYQPDQETFNYMPGQRIPAEQRESLSKKFRQQQLPMLDKKRGLCKERLRRDILKHGISVFIDSNQDNLIQKLADEQQQSELIKSMELERQHKLEQQKIRSKNQKQALDKFQTLAGKYFQASKQRIMTQLKESTLQVKSYMFDLAQKKKSEQEQRQKRIKAAEEEAHKQMKALERKQREELDRKRKLEKQKILFVDIIKKILNSYSDKIKKCRKLIKKQYFKKWLVTFKKMKALEQIRQEKQSLIELQQHLYEFNVEKEHPQYIEKDKEFPICSQNELIRFKKYQKATLIQQLQEKLSQNNDYSDKKKLKIKMIMPKSSEEASSFDSHIEKAITSIFDEEQKSIQVAFSGEPADDFIHAIKNGGFSAMVMVVTNGDTQDISSNTMNIDDLKKFAQYLEIKQNNMSCSQINLSIIAVNFDQSYLKQITEQFTKSTSNRFIAPLQVFNITIFKKHFESMNVCDNSKKNSNDYQQQIMREIIENQLLNQNFVDLIVESQPICFESHQAINSSTYSLHQVFAHQFKILSLEIEENSIKFPDQLLESKDFADAYKVLNEFNYIFAIFKFCLKELLETVLAPSSKNEFHLIGTSLADMTLSTHQSNEVVKAFIQMPPLPAFNLHSVKQQLNWHQLIYILQKFFLKHMPTHEIFQFIPENFQVILNDRIERLLLQQCQNRSQQLFGVFLRSILEVMENANESLKFKIILTQMKSFVPLDTRFVLADKNFKDFLQESELTQTKQDQKAIKDLKERFPRDFKDSVKILGKRINYCKDVQKVDQSMINSSKVEQDFIQKKREKKLDSKHEQNYKSHLNQQISIK